RLCTTPRPIAPVPMTPTVGIAATCSGLRLWCGVGLAVVELARDAVFDQRQFLALAAKLGAAIGVSHARRRGNLVERDLFAGGSKQASLARVETNDHALSRELTGKRVLDRFFLFLRGLVLARRESGHHHRAGEQRKV